jgi:hypothetical protein
VDAATPAEGRGSTLRKDVVAGLINAVVSVPDGLASATEWLGRAHDASAPVGRE